MGCVALAGGELAAERQAWQAAQDCAEDPAEVEMARRWIDGLST